MTQRKPESTYGNIGAVNPMVRRVFERSRQLGLSDSELARRSGYGKSTVHYWRKHGRGAQTDTVQMLADLASVVGLELVLKEPD